MYAASIGKKQVSKTLKIALGVIVVAVVAIVVVGKLDKGETTPSAPDGSTAEKREAYLLSRGLQVDPTSSVAEVLVPEEFDERFLSYNEMLKADGFDLSTRKGQAVKKCSYVVTNRQDLGTRITAVLLVQDDGIVAGHLVDEDTGKLYPLSGLDAPAEQTILPTITDESLVSADGTVISGGETPADSTPVSGDAYPTD